MNNTENSFAENNSDVTSENAGSTVSALKITDSLKTDILDLLTVIFTFLSIFFTFSCVNENTDDYKVSIVYFLFFAFNAGVIIFREKCFRKQAIFPTVLLLLIFISFSVFSGYNILRILLSCYLFGYSLCALKGVSVFPLRNIEDAFFQLSALFFIPIKNVFLPYVVFFKKLKELGKNGNRKFAKAGGIILGVILAVPVFITVANLLNEADFVFHSVIISVLSKLSDIFYKITNIFPFETDDLLPTIFFTPFVFSFIFCAKHDITKTAISKAVDKQTVKKLSVVSSGVLSGFYSLISLVYVIFIISQFTYLISAFSGELPYGYTVSSYARQGFFQMSAVAVINFGLILLGEVFTKRNSKNELPKTWKFFSLFFCIFTMLLIIIATAKMGLYVNSLGFTEKRITVLIADFALFVTFILITVSIFKKNFPHLKVIFSTFVVTVSFLLIFSGSTFSSIFNTQMYLSGHHNRIDIDSIRLSDSKYIAAKNLNSLTNSKNPATAKKAKGQLHGLYVNYRDYAERKRTVDTLLFRSFLEENLQKIESFNKYDYFHDDYYEYEYDSDSDFPTVENEQNYLCTSIKISINTPEIISKIELKNSVFTKTVRNSDGAPLAFGQTVFVDDWCTKKDDGEFAFVTVTLENGENQVFELRKDGEFISENTENCLNIGKTEYFSAEIKTGKHGEIYLIKESY